MARKFLSVLLLLLVACARTPDAEAIRMAIHGMQDSAEHRRPAGVMEHVADDFVGNNGEFDRAGLERLVRARVLAQSVGVSIGRVEIELDGDRATARFPMTVTDGSGRWLPERRAALDVVTGWRREGGYWRCYNARWVRG